MIGFRRYFRGWGRFYVVLVPAVGGLIAGFLLYYFALDLKGHGVPEVTKAAAWLPCKGFQVAGMLPW